jgi:Protein of unknown function (DUF1186)
MSSYTSPVDKLLTYGDPRELGGDPWPDDLELGLTSEHIPELLRMVTDKELLNTDAEEDPAGWAPLHAMRALGQLRDISALEPLLAASDMLLDDDEGLGDWALEELPEVYALLGPQGIPSLASVLSDTSRDLYVRSIAEHGLKLIAQKYPEHRDACIEILARVLSATHEKDSELNGFIIGDLIRLKAVEVASAIEQAFAAEEVDQMIVGDWDDVQVDLGLKEPTEHLAPDFSSLASLFSPQQDALSSESTQPPLSGPGRYAVKPRKLASNAMTKKDKAKMSKVSRKKNKKKHK